MAEFGNARALYEEAQRARAEESRMLLVGEDAAREIEALEAKLREAEELTSATMRRADGHIARAELAERENRLASARIATLEAKLREAEERIAAHEAAAAQNIVNEVLLEERAEKAERERDEAWACLSTFARWWHDEMRDEMQPRNDMDGPHVGEWQTCPGEVCAEARAALGEKP